jgi:porin
MNKAAFGSNCRSMGQRSPLQGGVLSVTRMKPGWRLWRAARKALPLVFVLLLPALALANDAAAPAPQTEPPSPWITKMAQQDHMFGDWGGRRTALEKKGVSFFAFTHADMFGAVSGGNNQGFGVWNRIRGIVNVDMGKVAHIKGMSIMLTGTWNNGTDVGYDPRYLGSLFVVTGNDTIIHQLRLDQWWVQQELFHNKLELRVGQLGAETYFGWMPSGLNHFMMEPLFYAPLGLLNAYDKPDIHNSSPGFMVTYAPNKHFYYRTGVVTITHNELNYSGFEPIFRDGVSWLNDIAFKYGQPQKGADVKDYSGEAHFGFTYTGIANANFPVVKPGITSDGNVGYWANIIQPVWRVKSGSNRGLDVRAMYVWGPETKGVLPWDKELVLSGIFNGPIASRPQDSINVGLNVYMIRNFLNTPANLAANLPVTSEKDWEINYSCWVTKWWNVMPTVGVIQDLGANPRRGNGVMVGVRSFVNF